jgi:hypothetical protein
MPEEPKRTKYASNSSDAKEVVAVPEREKLQPVISGTARVQKRSVGQKLGELFSGPRARDVGLYVIQDVIVPAIKDILYDSTVGALEMRLYGGGVSRRARSSSSSSRTPYRTMSETKTKTKISSTSSAAPREREFSDEDRAMHNFGAIGLSSRGEAERVLDAMITRLEKFEVVTVADLYDFVNITSDFPDNQYGWQDLQGSRINRNHDGTYSLLLPKAVDLTD